LSADILLFNANLYYTKDPPSKEVLRFWMSPSVPDIFAIEVWGCLNSALILHVFYL